MDQLPLKLTDDLGDRAGGVVGSTHEGNLSHRLCPRRTKLPKHQCTKLIRCPLCPLVLIGEPAQKSVLSEKTCGQPLTLGGGGADEIKYAVNLPQPSLYILSGSSRKVRRVAMAQGSDPVDALLRARIDDNWPCRLADENLSNRLRWLSGGNLNLWCLWRRISDQSSQHLDQSRPIHPSQNLLRLRSRDLSIPGALGPALYSISLDQSRSSSPSAHWAPMPNRPTSCVNHTAAYSRVS